MQKCLTKPLTRKYSGCLVENPTCDYAERFGFSNLCQHPQHMDFHPNMASPGHQVDHNALYGKLKESRRSAYISKVKEFLEDMEHGGTLTPDSGV